MSNSYILSCLAYLTGAIPEWLREIFALFASSRMFLFLFSIGTLNYGIAFVRQDMFGAVVGGLIWLLAGLSYADHHSET